MNRVSAVGDGSARREMAVNLFLKAILGGLVSILAILQG